MLGAWVCQVYYCQNKIYEKVSDNEKLTSELTPPVPAPVETKKPAKKGSTKVAPMTTADMPKQPKKGKPIR